MKLKRKFASVVLIRAALAAAFFITGCAEKKAESIHTDYMDLSVKPGDDFYRYANGTWIKEQ